MPLLFSLDPASALTAQICRHLGCSLAAHEDRSFEDGEHKVRPLVDPGGQQVAVIATLAGDACASPQDKLMRLLFFLATLKDHGARRVIAVIPYLAYARKDERTQDWDPVSLRVVAQLLETVGTDGVVALEVHNRAAFDNAFRGRAQRLDGHRVFDDWVMQRMKAEVDPVRAASWTIASPDPGGVKRAFRWREVLQNFTQRDLGFAIVDKRRSGGQLTGGLMVAGDVQGRWVVLVDDLVSTGRTAAMAASALRQAGAIGVIFVVTHAVLSPDANDHLASPDIDHILWTDSISPSHGPLDLPWAHKVTVVSAGALLSKAIDREFAATSMA